MPKILYLIPFDGVAFLKYGGSQNICNEGILALVCTWGQ